MTLSFLQVQTTIFFNQFRKIQLNETMSYKNGNFPAGSLSADVAAVIASSP
jgi:hypothetical protein